MPTTLRGYVRQQVRWNKSFFRESLLLVGSMRPNRWAWWLAFAELGYWMVLSTMLMLSVVVRPVVHSHLPAWQYAAFVALMAYGRSIRMIGDHGRLLPTSFLLAPLYGVLNLVLLVPLRFYSLIRLRDGSWGTRWRGARHRIEAQDPEPIVAPRLSSSASPGGATGVIPAGSSPRTSSRPSRPSARRPLRSARAGVASVCSEELDCDQSGAVVRCLAGRFGCRWRGAGERTPL